QAAVTLGSVGVARRDGDYFPALVAVTILGGGYSARLNQEIRIKRGLSYGASSGMGARFSPAPIIAAAQTRNDAAPQVVSLMQGEFTKLGGGDVGADELSARKASLIGGFARTVETNAGVAGQISTLALFGLPPERLQTYVADVSAVTPAQIRAAAQHYFDPAHAEMVVVGDASIFYDALSHQHPGVEPL